MKKIIFSRGITLIELVIAVVIVGIAVPVLVRNWADVTIRSVESETISDAAFYAEQLMEEIKSKRFDERTDPPWTAGNLFGAKRADESDEMNNRTRFDDVDDYDGFTEPLPRSFVSLVSVQYANLTGTTWQAVASGTTDFKRVTVNISRKNILNAATLVTVIGRY
jgi:prepilin-type N-terminal cleavage/methylation domain-containing protein